MTKTPQRPVVFRIPRFALRSGALAGCAFVAGTAWGSIDFNRDVRPILSDNCYKCHGPDEEYREADLRLDTQAGALSDLGEGIFAIVPGDPEASEVMWRVGAEDEEDLMPPPDSGLSLSAEEKAILEKWIADGAEWSGHWSFEPVKRPELPEVANEAWVRNGIDAFILSRLEAEGISPSDEADKTTLIRRVTLDLTGLPPTPEEVDAFLADDAPGAYGRLVDRLLASPRYGEAMALPWLEAARYADTDGYQNDGPRDMWRWRDWVIEAYNRNLPFDQFTIEQLAGDLLENPTLDQLIATGFNRNHRYNSESGLVLEEFLLENAVDRVDTTSTVWMGLTMGCARCHDHKYDPISIKEYYQLISLFDNVTESGRAIKFGNSEPWITAPTNEQAAELAVLDQRVAEARAERTQAASRISEWIVSGKLGDALLDEGQFVSRGLVERYSFEAGEALDFATDERPIYGNGSMGRGATFDGTTSVAFESAFGYFCHDRFSLSFWVRPDDVSDSVILSKQDVNTRRPGLAVELVNGKLQFNIITRWIAGVGSIETLDRLKPGEWTHVALTNDGTQRARGMHIYLNGERVETRTLHNTNSNVVNTAKNAPLRLGKGVIGEPFAGGLDEIRVYDRTLFPDEVALLATPESVYDIVFKRTSDLSATAIAKRAAYLLESLGPEPLKAIDARYHSLRMERQAFHDSLPTTMVMEELDTPRKTHVRARGVYHQYGEEVTAGLPEVLPDFPDGASRDRLGLAQWLVSGEHPLTGRVSANRYWIKYFGRGLVKSAENFGLQGDWPSHPELLDWLADEFVRLDWDVKAMQKLIVTSATYRQSSRVTPELLERDPENVLLARGPRQRLTAQAARDQALAVSGLLAERLGGPSVSPYQPDKLWDLMSNMKYSQSSGDDLYRRSLYTIWKRTVPPPSMALMDAADREVCMISSNRTNTPLQALTLLNEKTYVEAARNLGQRILLEAGDAAEDRVVLGFRLALARRPNERELETLTSAYAAYRAEFAEDLVGAERLIGIGESDADDSLDPRELAAATTLANVLLNLDETITKE